MDLDRLCRTWPAPDGDPFNCALLPCSLWVLTANCLDAGVGRLVLAGVAENMVDRDGYQAAMGMWLKSAA